MARVLETAVASNDGHRQVRPLCELLDTPCVQETPEVANLGHSPVRHRSRVLSWRGCMDAIKENIAADLQRLRDVAGADFGQEFYKRHGNYSLYLLKKMYGSWSLAMKEVFNRDPRSTSPRTWKPCKTCGELTKNPKFCSQSCSAISANKYGARTKWGPSPTFKKCKVCGSAIPNHKKRRRCVDCRWLLKTVSGDYVSLGKATKSMLLCKGGDHHNRIRDHARRMAEKSGVLEECFICGYRFHVECAHVKPLKDFGGDELISEINSAQNLVGLCPNHHWELDNGILDLSLYLNK